MRDGQTRYTPVPGIDELREAVCRYVEDGYGLKYTKENVLISCGGKHAIYNLLQVLIDPGDEVIIPAPYWVSYPDMVGLGGGVPVAVPCTEENHFKLQPRDLEKAITAKSRLFIINSPCNPTGVSYTEPELKALAEVLLPYKDLLIMSDDIYNRILFGGRKWVDIVMADPRLQDRTFIINGVSKTYCMTGWRIGFLVGNEDVIKAASKIQSQSTSNPTSISQWASVAALNGDQGVVEKMAKTFEGRCRYVLKRLGEIPGVSCPEPSGAFYVFPNCSRYYGKKAAGRAVTNSVELADYLMENAHIAVVPGSAFGEDRCIRLSYALSMSDLEEGFNRLSTGLKSLA